MRVYSGLIFRCRKLTDSAMNAYKYQQVKSKPASENMRVYVVTLKDKKLALYISSCYTIYELKLKVQERDGTQPEE